MPAPDDQPTLLGPGEAPADEDQWREAVLDLRYGERRRVFPATVHVGTPGSGSAAWELPAHRRHGEPPCDQALRSDVVAALLDRHRSHEEPGAREPSVWLTRSGPLGEHDEDTAWLSGARTAYAEAGLVLRIAVVTHAGWYDPRTGDGRRWKRLRRR